MSRAPEPEASLDQVAEVQVKPWPSEEQEAAATLVAVEHVAHGVAALVAHGWEEVLAASLLEVQGCAL